MASLRLVSPHADIQWAVLVQLGAAEPDPMACERTCLRVWSGVAARSAALGVGDPESAVVRAGRGALVLVRRDAGLAAALVRPRAVVSVVIYELREALTRSLQAVGATR